MIHHIIHGTLNHQAVNDLGAIIRQHGCACVGIDSDGGDPSAGWSLGIALADTQSVPNVAVFGYAYSSAFYALIVSGRSVEIHPGAVGMLHYPSYEAMVAPSGKMTREHKQESKGSMLMMQDYKRWLDGWAAERLSQKEYGELRRGGDVYLDSERLRAIFQPATII